MSYSKSGFSSQSVLVIMWKHWTIAVTEWAPCQRHVFLFFVYLLYANHGTILKFSQVLFNNSWITGLQSNFVVSHRYLLYLIVISSLRLFWSFIHEGTTILTLVRIHFSSLLRVFPTPVLSNMSHTTPDWEWSSTSDLHSLLCAHWRKHCTYTRNYSAYTVNILC